MRNLQGAKIIAVFEQNLVLRPLQWVDLKSI